MSNQPLSAHLAGSQEDYQRLGIKPRQIDQWEDGLRTHTRKGTYEWWYFDAYLNDGAKLVIVFYTKPIVDVDKPLTPQVSVTLDRADGTHLEHIVTLPASTFTAAQDHCDVRIGPNTFAGDLHTYQIHVAVEDLEADVTLTGTVPAWRAETGVIVFGAEDEHTFAWLPAVPQGDVTATITIAGQQETFTGQGYHDHNWGNISMVQLMHHWYWARGQIGDYTIIASYITSEKRYGYQAIPVFMLAYQGRVIADDASKVRFSASDSHTDPATGKPVANVTVYEYRDGDQHYKLTFTRQNTILRMKLVESIAGIRGFLARLIGFDGAYERFTGDLTLDRYEGDRLVASEHAEAIWELMYFGHVPKGKDEG